MTTHQRFCLTLGLWLIPAISLLAQIGINLPAEVKPTNDFEVYARSGFLVQQKYRYVSVNPTASVNDLSCVTPSTDLTALAGILKDPTGDANYTPGVSYSCVQSVYLGSIDSFTQAGAPIVGIEITVEQLNTESSGGDRVVIEDESGNRVVSLYGNENEWVGFQIIARGTRAKVTFIADGDATVGTGFRLRWRALLQEYPDPNAFIRLPFGTSFYFDAYTGAMRTGYLDQTNNSPGYWSFTAGSQNKASGSSGAAIGSLNNVQGYSSVALGSSNFIGNISNAVTMGNSNTAVSNNSLAVGQYNRSGAESAIAGGRSNTATAEAAIALGKLNSASAVAASTIGLQNVAMGEASTSIGESNTALNDNSIAIGRGNMAGANDGIAFGRSNQTLGSTAVTIGESTTALGQRSVAMGYRVSTGNFAGSFILGDNTSGITTGAAANQFTARYTGGFRMVTAVNGSGVPTAGVSLTAGGTSWATLSDSTCKELFHPIDGSDLLRKIGTMKLTTWNYKNQRGIRHYGPMAQEFFSLFGRDKLGAIGSDKLITTQDIEGLTLTAVQALVWENSRLKTELQGLKAETKTKTDHLEGRLNELESILLGKRQLMAYRAVGLNRRKSTTAIRKIAR